VDAFIPINARLSIPAAELVFRATRSGGPGGQHVNTSSTRIELVFDVAQSPSLSGAQRQRLLEALAPRLDKAGLLRIVAQTERSQSANRDEAIRRFRSLLAAALRPRKQRVATAPTHASRERRYQSKQRRGSVKRQRGRVRREED
jgi:ribosome-associated protein